MTKEERREYWKQYFFNKRKRYLEQKKRYRVKHADKISEYQKQYNKTQMGRAAYLVQGYKKADKNASRGKCTLTAKWVVENIFAEKCIYCGESDWTKLGCDRIDNSKPHTEDNVVPCCKACNNKRGAKPYEQFLQECTKEQPF